MKIFNLEQGTQEWLDERLKHFTASEAPIVMGTSKHMTRKQLLDHKKGWVTLINKFTMALFEKGHQAEEDQRSVLELETMDEYLPLVSAIDYLPTNNPDAEVLPLMASLDGRSDMQDHCFEHKLWNEVLAENVRNKILTPAYYWQLEHQLLVTGDDYVLFVVSDGTAENREMMKYYPVSGRREELIEAWILFQSDLKGHQIKAKEEVVVAEKQYLPSIECSVIGSQITTNLPSCLVAINELANSEMQRVLETDLDFSNKEQLNKDVIKVRAELKDRVAKVKGEFVSYSEFESVALELDKVLQKMQSHGEKQVKQAKEAKKLAIKNAGELSIANYLYEVNEKINPMTISSVSNLFMPDFDLAMKGKRNIDSIEDAVSTCVNQAKIEIKQVLDRVEPNLNFLREYAAEYEFLFNDAQNLVNQESEPFQAIVKLRISDHKESERLRIKGEREKIRLEEEAKAKLKADAEAKALAESERKKIRLEEEAKLKADAEVHIEKEIKEPVSTNEDYPVKGTGPDFKGVNPDKPNAFIDNQIHTESTIEVNQGANVQSENLSRMFGESEAVVVKPTLSSASITNHVLNLNLSNGAELHTEMKQGSSTDETINNLFGMVELLRQL